MHLICRIGFHKWLGCMCVRCSATKDSDHSVSEFSCECSACGTKVHEWVRLKVPIWDVVLEPACYGCRKCSACRHTWGPWDGGRGHCVCPRCGEFNPYHQGRGVGGLRVP
jgi:hypothetical protein